LSFQDPVDWIISCLFIFDFILFSLFLPFPLLFPRVFSSANIFCLNICKAPEFFPFARIFQARLNFCKAPEFFNPARIFQVRLNFRDAPKFFNPARIFQVSLNFSKAPKFFYAARIFQVRLNFFKAPKFSSSARILQVRLNFCEAPKISSTLTEFFKLAYFFMWGTNAFKARKFFPWLA
jgi:hypothetical protein